VNSWLVCGLVSKKAEGFSAKQSARAGGGRLGQVFARARAELLGRSGTVAFSFSFSAVFELCLILYNKSFAGPKIVKIFV
jgi:hypothetical protein